MLGLNEGSLHLVEHQPEWAALFDEEKTRLSAAIGRHILDIQHIGSTSIPGLPAKPILDIAVGVEKFETAAVCIPLLEPLGYLYRGEHGIPRRHYFVKRAHAVSGDHAVQGQPRTHHLHMLEIDSQGWRDHLLFRDTLRRDAALAAEYTNFKRQIASQFKDDREAYQTAKDKVVSRLLERVKPALNRD